MPDWTGSATAFWSGSPRPRPNCAHGRTLADRAVPAAGTITIDSGKPDIRRYARVWRAGRIWARTVEVLPNGAIDVEGGDPVRPGHDPGEAVSGHGIEGRGFQHAP